MIRQKSKGKYVLSLDVGTKMAKALVSYVDFEAGSVTNLGVGRCEQEAGNIVGGKIVEVDKVAEALRCAADDAAKMAKVRPQEAVMGFSGNTIRIFTHAFEMEREDPQAKIDSSELREIVGEAYSRSLEEIERSLAFRERQAGFKVVSADIINFSIDGYRVINPLSFKGGMVKVGISTSFVLMPDFDIISDISDRLNVKLLKVSYGPYAVIKAIGAEDSLNFSAIMIDVGGNITDVVLVKNGNIQNAGMFILGGRLFTRRLAHKLGLPEKSAEEIKMKYAADRFAEVEKAKIGKMLSEDIELWLSGVQLVLGEAGAKFLLPSKIFLYGGGSQLPGIASSLNGLDSSGIAFLDKIKVNFIRMDHIVRNSDKTRQVKDFQDITLISLAHLCFDSADEEDTANGLLAEIVKNNQR